jgi:hypothetical protein
MFCKKKRMFRPMGSVFCSMGKMFQCVSGFRVVWRAIGIFCFMERMFHPGGSVVILQGPV